MIMKSFESFLTEERLERLNFETKVKRLNGLVSQMGEGYRKGSERVKRLPVDSSCRIMMEPFRQVHGEEEVKADIDYVKDRERKWQEEDHEREQESIGEQFELLKTAIFNKYLGERFIVVRSSFYDDYKNGVDNVMVDIQNGNVVCAFDEVGDDSFFKKLKEEKVSAKNLEEGGSSLKYGIKLKDGHPVATRLQNLPIFCLSLSADKIREGIQEMEFSVNKKSSAEDKMFEVFMEELKSQVI